MSNKIKYEDASIDFDSVINMFRAMEYVHDDVLIDKQDYFLNIEYNKNNDDMKNLIDSVTSLHCLRTKRDEYQSIDLLHTPKIKQTIEYNVEEPDTILVECDLTSFESLDSFRKFTDDVNMVDLEIIEKDTGNRHKLILDSGTTIILDEPYTYDEYNAVRVGYIHIESEDIRDVREIRSKLYKYTSHRKSELFDGWFSFIREPISAYNYMN